MMRTVRSCEVVYTLAPSALIALLGISGCAVEGAEPGSAEDLASVQRPAGGEEMTGEADEALKGPVCLAAAAGKYCGNDQISGGSASTLYSCPGGAGRPASLVQVCSNGCRVMPAGTNDVCAPTPIVIASAALTIFNAGNYDGTGRLLWDDSLPKEGGYRFKSPYGVKVVSGGNGYTRINAAGDTTGQCVDLVKSLSGQTGATTGWIKGLRAVDSCASIPLGTAVATFSGTSYSGHTGFLCGCSASAVTLCDENYVAAGLVGRHTINKTGSGSVGDAGAYYAVTSSN